MESKRAQVIMLPTKAYTNVVLNTYINATHRAKAIYHIRELMDTSTKTITSLEDRGYRFQHLYFTTDEEPNNSDYYLCPKNLIRKCRTSFEIGGRKIVATTDTSLIVTDYNDGTLNDFHLPHPSQAFIEKYCELGGIDEVFIDYETYEQFDGTLLPGHTYPKKTTLKTDSHNTITIHPVKNSWNRNEIEDILSNYFFVNSDTSDEDLKILIADIMSEFN